MGKLILWRLITEHAPDVIYTSLYNTQVVGSCARIVVMKVQVYLIKNIAI